MIKEVVFLSKQVGFYFMKKSLIVFYFLSFILCNTSNDVVLKSGGDYYTDELGNVYIYVNIIGHVKSPGTYLIHEGASIIDAISKAGGHLQGAKLRKVVLHQNDKGVKIIDLKNHLEFGYNSNTSINPNDTIYIKQSMGSYLFSKSNIINSVLQVLNIYLTINRKT